MNEANIPEFERRRYPRKKGPVFFSSSSIFGLNISLGGVRVYSDKPFKKGKRLELDIFLSDKHSIIAPSRVMWIKKIPSGTDTIYDAGLEFVKLSPYAFKELKGVMGKAETG